MQSLERGLRVLDHLNLVGFATNSEIARALGLKRATVHRITAVLVDVGLLHMDRPSSLLMLTAAVTSLSRRLTDEARVGPEVPPVPGEWTFIGARPVGAGVTTRGDRPGPGADVATGAGAAPLRSGPALASGASRPDGDCRRSES